MQSAAKAQRLGTEKIGKLLLEMSSQTTFSLLVYAVYTITDIYFLSVGVNSLAAAGASIISPVLIALGGVATIVGTGGASVVSRALGAQEPARASQTVANTFLIFWAVAIAITIFGTLWIEPIVHLFGATESIAPYAIEYGRIIFLGAITSTGFSAIVRADGSVGFSTALWVVPVTVNFFLCWLFIMVLGMGAGGAALATVMGQGVSAVMSLYFFFFKRNRSYRIKAAYFLPDRRIIGEVLLIGLPSFLKSMSASVVVIITNNLLKVLGGDGALAVFAIVGRLYSALAIPQTGIMQGMQPLVGFNFGQQRFGRVRDAVTLSLRASVIYGVVVCAICLLLPGALIGLLSNERSIVEEGQVALRWLSLAYPLGGVAMLIAAYFQSVGEAKQALAITLGGMLLIKVPILLLASRLFGLTGIWAAEAVSELLLSVGALALLRNFQRAFGRTRGGVEPAPVFEGAPGGPPPRG
jgi:putative MATE family efflux protein